MKKFHSIYTDLVDKIKDETYSPGDKIPGELKLSSMYDVSRETVRKALSLLVENGYIQKSQGRSAIVLDTKKLKISGSTLSSFKQMKSDSNDTEIELLKNKKEKLPKHLSEQMALDENTQVIALERLRKIQGRAVILEKVFVLTSVVEVITLEAVYNSLFEYIEQITNLKIGYARRHLTIEKVTDEDKMLLDIGKDTHVAVIRSEVYLEDTRLVQLHESRHRVDTIDYYDIARKKDEML